MNMSCESKWGEEIRRGLSEGFEPGARAALGAHLKGCDACRARYDREAEAVAALEGRAGIPGEAARGAILANVLDALEAEGALAPARPATVLPFPRGRVIGALIAVGALAAGLAVVLTRPEPVAAPEPAALAPLEFEPRGAAEAHQGFGLYCIGVGGGAPRIESSATSGTNQVARCHLSDRLQFTYSLEPAAGRGAALALFATGPDGRVAWYWPQGESGASLQAPARQAPLPGSFDLAVRHVPGRWRVYGVFGERLPDRATIEARLGQGGAAALRSLEPGTPLTIIEAAMEISE